MYPQWEEGVGVVKTAASLTSGLPVKVSFGAFAYPYECNVLNRSEF